MDEWHFKACDRDSVFDEHGAQVRTGQNTNRPRGTNHGVRTMAVFSMRFNPKGSNQKSVEPSRVRTGKMVRKFRFEPEEKTGSNHSG